MIHQQNGKNQINDNNYSYQNPQSSVNFSGRMIAVKEIILHKNHYESRREYLFIKDGSTWCLQFLHAPPDLQIHWQRGEGLPPPLQLTSFGINPIILLKLASFGTTTQPVIYFSPPFWQYFSDKQLCTLF